MEKKTNETVETKPIVEEVEFSIGDDPKVKGYEAKLFELRKDGVLKIAELVEEMSSIKHNKMIDAETKSSILSKDKELLHTAKEVKAKNKTETEEIVKEALNYIKTISKVYEAKVTAVENEKKVAIISTHKQNVAKLAEDHRAKLSDINSQYVGQLTKDQIDEKKTEIKNENFSYKSSCYDETNRYNTGLQRVKDNKYNAYNDRYNEAKIIRNGTSSFLESQEYKFKNFGYKFIWKKFLLNNALYFVIIAFFIFCSIYAPFSGQGDLFSLQNIFNILENSSTRMFYAMGVAGLILIAGTDLSVGRMVALGSVTTALILHDGPNVVTLFSGDKLDFTSMPMFSRVALALVLSIIFCTIFSFIAGFFTAKFKMHPFISTLSTQLIIYGLLYYATNGTPAGNIDSGIKDLIGGRWYIPGSSITFPKLIIPMILVIIVIWFIWNKTKFGKNMYAVGGNAEAASVSGINVFWVTLGIFILAGVCYGCGSFLEAFRANASAGTGQGYELDAIAACVVGGISFNGGIGKVKGAVVGVIIFTALTYALNFLGIDTNLQFVFKGIIILSAVALDCVKYIRRK